MEIDGITFPIDLTWDSGRMQRGQTDLEYFGCKRYFEQNHIQDADENQYNLSCFDRESISGINTSRTIRQPQITEQDKKDIVQRAIKETYEKFKLLQGKEQAKNQVQKAIMNYIKDGDLKGFTRQNNARDGIEQYITREDMLNLVINEHVNNNEGKKGDVLSTSIQETSNRYGKQHTNEALKKYILENNINSFTRQNNARSNMEHFMSPQNALKQIVAEMAVREISIIENNNILKNNMAQTMGKQVFELSELEKVQLPVEKQKTFISKAMEWIKNKMLERKQNKDMKTNDINKNVQKQGIKRQDER